MTHRFPTSDPMTPYVISGGRVYVRRPDQTRAAVIATANLTRPELTR